MKFLPITLSVFLFPVLLFSQARTFSYKTSTNEADVPAYTLPDPLLTSRGKAVRNVRQWEKKRRPEILRMLTCEMFGTAPGRPEWMRFETVSVDSSAFDGLATRKTVRIIINDTVCFHSLIHVPNAFKEAVPVFVGLNFYGNAKTLEGEKAYQWPYRMILSAGYAVATVWRDEIELDTWNKKDRGIRDAFPANYTWGTIAAWAWALSRVMDYIETDPCLDAGKAIVIGHSRLGKAAVWAGATDRRFAMVVSNNSGCGGAALSKRVFGENLDAIQEKFPHWFCSNFQKYRKNEESLPFDQHELLALVAPRPLYVASSTEDLWADPKGEWLSAIYASPVYRLYGLEGLSPDVHPVPDTPLQNGSIAYHIKTGRHSIMPYDWEQYIRFADKFFK